MISKRAFLTGLAASGLAGRAFAETGPASLSANAKPIGATERLARINKLQGLMQAQGIAALLVESGSTLDYSPASSGGLPSASQRRSCRPRARLSSSPRLSRKRASAKPCKSRPMSGRGMSTKIRRP